MVFVALELGFGCRMLCMCGGKKIPDAPLSAMSVAVGVCVSSCGVKRLSMLLMLVEARGCGVAVEKAVLIRFNFNDVQYRLPLFCIAISPGCQGFVRGSFVYGAPA